MVRIGRNSGRLRLRLWLFGGGVVFDIRKVCPCKGADMGFKVCNNKMSGCEPATGENCDLLGMISFG